MYPYNMMLQNIYYQSHFMYEDTKIRVLKSD